MGKPSQLTYWDTWKHHGMEAMALCEGNPSITGRFPPHSNVELWYFLWSELNILLKPSSCRLFQILKWFADHMTEHQDSDILHWPFRSTIAKFKPWPSARGPMEQLNTWSVRPYNSRMGRDPSVNSTYVNNGGKRSPPGTPFTHTVMVALNTLRPRKNGRRFAGDVFKCIFLNEYVWISLKWRQAIIWTNDG